MTVKLKSAEVAEEVAWLMGGGMSPIYVCEALGRTPDGVYKALWRAGRKDLMGEFSPLIREGRVRRERGQEVS
jgi:hypothetical protein